MNGHVDAVALVTALASLVTALVALVRALKGEAEHSDNVEKLVSQEKRITELESKN